MLTVFCAVLARRRRLAASTSKRYVPVATARKAKNVAGRAVKPSTPARGPHGKYIPIATTARQVAVKGALGRLLNGFFDVRMTNNTSGWVASDSMNHPV